MFFKNKSLEGLVNPSQAHQVERDNPKILLLSDFAFNKNGVNAGTERQVFGIAKWLNENGFVVDILTPNWNNEVFIEDIEGVRVFRFETHDIHKPNFLRRHTDYMSAAEVLPRYDVYHGFSTLAPIFASLFLSQQRNAKSFITIFIRENLEKNFFLPKRILYHFLKKADFVTCNFYETQQYYLEKKIFPKEKLKSIFCWVEDYFKPMPEIEKTKGLKTVLFVGRMVKEKGIYVLLDAIAQVKTEIPLRLLIVGLPYEKETIEAYAKMIGVQDEVNILGYVPEEEMPRMYNEADVLVAPSLNKEGFTWTTFEAMACGTPVVCTSKLELPFFVGSFQVVAKPGDSESLARGITLVLKNPGNYSKNGLKIAGELFNKEKIMLEWKGVYDSLCK